MHSSVLRRIWLNFMAQYLVFSTLFTFHIFFRTSNFFDPSTTDETSLVEMRIWCIKIGIVLTLHLPRLSRSAFKFPVCLTYLASLHHQLTPAAIYILYNLWYLRRSLIQRCPRHVN